MTMSADTLAAGYEALFSPLMRTAQIACLEHARLTRDDGWPGVEGCLAFAKLYGVPSAELAAFFGHVCYGIVRRPTVWVNVLADEPGSHAARQLATRAQLTALGFQLAVADLHASEHRKAMH